MKKIGLFSVMVIMFILNVGVAHAQNDFTADDIINKVKEGDTYKLLNTNGAITINKTSYGIAVTTLSEGTNYNTEFVMENGILTYNLVDDLEETALVMQSSMDATWIGEFCSAVAVLNGYTRDFLSKIDETILTFEKNGVEYITGTYQAFGLPYKAIKSMRININDLRLDTSSTPTPGPEVPDEDEKVPNITLSNISDSSITISISNTNEGATCRVYKAVSDGEYALLTTIPCSQSYVDNDIKENMLYSYRVDTGNDLMSEPKSATTPKKPSSSNGNNNGNNNNNNSSGTVSNPQTGIISNGLIVLVVGIVGVLSLNVLRKKDVFKKL